MFHHRLLYSRLAPPQEDRSTRVSGTLSSLSDFYNLRTRQYLISHEGGVYRYRIIGLGHLHWNKPFPENSTLIYLLELYPVGHDGPTWDLGYCQQESSLHYLCVGLSSSETSLPPSVSNVPPWTSTSPPSLRRDLGRLVRDGTPVERESENTTSRRSLFGEEHSVQHQPAKPSTSSVCVWDGTRRTLRQNPSRFHEDS